MASEKQRKATIADVAEKAGVSIKTVSRVANKEPNVRDETRRKVQKAIDALNYMPDPSARNLAARRSYLIALLYDNPSASYLIDVQNGSLAACRQAGYGLVIHPCDYRASDLTRELANMIRQTKIDGVILTPPLSDMQVLVDMLETVGTPFVLVSPANQSRPDISVYTNDREVCAEMTASLYELGHRRIGFIIGHPDHGAVGHRYLGYTDGLKRCGLNLTKNLIQQGYNSFDSGELCAKRLLNLTERPTAIFASNDDMAAGAMKAVHEAGIRIPEDISIVGFDDASIASQLWPSLTTIRQPIYDLAERAAQLLLTRLRGGSASEMEHTIESELLMRESTGPAKLKQRA